jgi:hypothetical protein
MFETGTEFGVQNWWRKGRVVVKGRKVKKERQGMGDKG